MNKRQQMQDILKDTVEYYAKDPANRRSTDKDGNCNYTWGQNHCAVGRYLKPEYQREDWESNNEAVNELCEDSSDGWNIDWCLRDEVKGLDADFWSVLQDMHDTIGHWEEWHEHKDGLRKYGLTDRGKEAYVSTQDRIARGDYDG